MFSQSHEITSNYQWASSYLAPWPWTAVLDSGNPSHPLHVTVSSISKVGIACSVFCCDLFPRREGSSREETSVQVKWRPGEDGACPNHPPRACGRGPLSIHHPIQKGSDPRCQASLFKGFFPTIVCHLTYCTCHVWKHIGLYLSSS